MLKMRRIACASVASACLLASSTSHAENESKASFLTMGTPMLKVNFRRTGVFAEPSFTPGPGFGYIWDKGKWGVVVFPGLGIFDRGNITLSPTVAFHAYFFSAGVGYELRFARTNNGDETRLYSGYPIVTLGLSLPIQAWWQQK